MPTEIDLPRQDIIELVRLYARAYGIDETIALRQIWQESRFNPRAVSPSDCRGLAQLNPKFYGSQETGFWHISDYYNPFESLLSWAGTMRWLLSEWSGDYRKALASYNAGIGAVRRLTDSLGNRWEEHLGAEARLYLRIILGDRPSLDAILSGEA